MLNVFPLNVVTPLKSDLYIELTSKSSIEKPDSSPIIAVIPLMRYLVLNYHFSFKTSTSSYIISMVDEPSSRLFRNCYIIHAQIFVPFSPAKASFNQLKSAIPWYNQL
jgi:hypothetical protein